LYLSKCTVEQQLKSGQIYLFSYPYLVTADNHIIIIFESVVDTQSLYKPIIRLDMEYRNCGL
jgi:hypothetical protein